MDQEFAAIEPSRKSNASRGVTILIVEDSPVQTELLRRALEGADYKVIAAGNGAEGLAMAKANHPAAVVSDVNMPFMDGYAMCQAMRREESLKFTPVILLTMLSDTEDVIHGLNAGADAYLTKPYNIPSLLARIASLLAYPPAPPPSAERRRLEVHLAGEIRTVDAHGPRMLNLLVSTYENAVLQNRELNATQRALEDLNQHLEQKVLEQTAALQASMARYERAVNGANDGIWEWSPATGKVYMSPRWKLLLGFKDHELPDVQESFFDRIHPEDKARAKEMVRAHLEERNPYSVELRLLCKSGEYRWFSSRGQAEWNEQGRPLIMSGSISDITERKLAEAALQRESRRNQIFLRNASDGVHILDSDGKVLEISDSFCKMLGYTREELIGANVSLWDAQWSPQDLKQRIAEQMAKKDGAVLETRHRRQDGSFLEVEITGRGLELDGKPVLFNSARDITERKVAETKIRDYAEQLKTAFMSSVEVATTLSEMRDPYTAGHERRVAEIAVAIGAELGLDSRRQEGLRVAGHLHDVGKITIPAEILSKPGNLSAIEHQLIQGHPQASHDVLKDVKFPWPVAQIALQHHERMDGSGYPQGLKGEAILLEARIMAVADVVEAMASHRPYRQGLGIEVALAEIERRRGTAYDPAVADACLRVFRLNGYQLPA